MLTHARKSVLCEQLVSVCIGYINREKHSSSRYKPGHNNNIIYNSGEKQKSIYRLQSSSYLHLATCMHINFRYSLERCISARNNSMHDNYVEETETVTCLLTLSLRTVHGSASTMVVGHDHHL